MFAGVNKEKRRVDSEDSSDYGDEDVDNYNNITSGK